MHILLLRQLEGIEKFPDWELERLISSLLRYCTIHNFKISLPSPSVSTECNDLFEFHNTI